MTPWQKARTKVYLLGVGLLRRMTLGVRGALIDGDRVFLVRHTYLPGWHFPGGGVEPGESAEAAVAREVLEETGLRLFGGVELFGFYHNTVTSDRDHVALYVARDFEVVRAFAPSGEIADGDWFGLDHLPDELTPGTRRRLAEIFKNVSRTPVW